MQYNTIVKIKFVIRQYLKHPLKNKYYLLILIINTT